MEECGWKSWSTTDVVLFFLALNERRFGGKVPALARDIAELLSAGDTEREGGAVAGG